MKRVSVLSPNWVLFLAGMTCGMSAAGWALMTPVCPSCELRARAQLSSLATDPLGGVEPNVPTNFSALMNVASFIQPRAMSAAPTAAMNTPRTLAPAPASSFDPGFVFPTYNAASADPTGGALKLDTSFPVPPSPLSGYFGDSWWVSSTVPGLVFYNPGPSFPSFFQPYGPSQTSLGLQQVLLQGNGPTLQGVAQDSLIPPQTAEAI